MGSRQVYLIDATAFCYRAFYALQRQNLSTSFGQPTSAIYGFVGMLKKLLRDYDCAYIGVCFDVSRDTFRQKKFAEYKINRPAAPDELTSQFPYIKEIISAYGMAIFEKEGFEADDVIATLAVQAKSKGFKVVIVSSDKDMLQLVDKDVSVLSPNKQQDMLFDEKKVRQVYGLLPRQIPDMISLMGDSVDNIPNLPGIGQVTASALIREFGSLEALIKGRDRIKKEKTRDCVNAHLDMLKLNRELVGLNDRLELDFDPEKLKAKPPDYEALFRIFKRLEFKKFLKEIPAPQEKSGEGGLKPVQEDEIDRLARQSKELYIWREEGGSLVLGAQDSLCRPRSTAALKELFSDPRIKKLGHDLKAIKVDFEKEGICLQGLYFDTMICAWLLDPSSSAYRIEDLAWDYLQERLDTRRLASGQALDAIIRLRPGLEDKLGEKSLSKLFFELEMPLEEVLAEMESCGIKLDLELLKGLSSQIEKKLIGLIADIYESSGTQFNINSPKQLASVLFEKLKLPVIKRSKTGPSTDEEVLRRLADKHKLPSLLLEYRQLTKLKNTYIDALPQLVDPATGRVHSSFNQTGTETGRLSSANPNLQNIPVKTEIGRRIRQAVVPLSEHSCLLSCDYSQIELRILAHISKDQRLVSAFRDDKDIHKATAALIFGLEESQVVKDLRETAKRVNFGIVYGLTAYGLSRDLGISASEAQSFIDAYFIRYPGVKLYMEEQVERARKAGFVTTILGRRRYIPDINNKNPGIRQFAERQAINTPIQGSASDLIKLAMVDIHRLIKEKGLKSRMILQIHDELVFDVPEKELLSFRELAKDRMENVLGLDVPVRVSVKKGKNWLDMEETG